MGRISQLILTIACVVSYHASADTLPKVTGLELNGNLLTWDAQDGASGYNIHRDYDYFDTVRGALEYTVTEPGKYHVISFNDYGVYGVTRSPDEAGQPYTYVEYTYSQSTTLPKVTGLALKGKLLTWDAQDGASGYNIHRDYDYFDTVRGALEYTVTEPGKYHVISFNDNGVYGVTRNPEEGGQAYVYLEYTACHETGVFEPACTPELVLSDPAYFKEVALKVEFGSGNGVIKKWRDDINYHVSGEPGAELLAELDKVVGELNDLMDVQLLEVEEEGQANFRIFFGSGEDYANNFEQNAQELINSNFGLVWAYWNSSYELIRGSMYVDIFRTLGLRQQKHLLREELTQSIGLFNDTYDYPDSIFYAGFSQTTEYAPIDREVIQLLYSSDILAGMTEEDVNMVLEPLPVNYAQYSGQASNGEASAELGF
ncbi:MAG: DUF2927 domain-containing protein [Rhodothermales bacterium]|nr:DUF2927 domain-containing protein [Rhodothermales bacterium]